MVWISDGHLPSAVSFDMPFQIGDRITGLAFDALGDGSSPGLQNTEVIYRADGESSYHILGRGNDVGRMAQWGQVSFTGDDFHPTDLSSGVLWVQFDAYEVGYYLSMVTAIFERQCPSSSGKG